MTSNLKCVLFGMNAVGPQPLIIRKAWSMYKSLSLAANLILLFVQAFPIMSFINYFHLYHSILAHLDSLSRKTWNKPAVCPTVMANITLR